MNEPEKSYGEDLKETFQGLFFLVIIGLVVLFISGIVGIIKDDSPAQYNPSRVPTTEDYKRWDAEYEKYGDQDPNIDVIQQFGGR